LLLVAGRVPAACVAGAPEARGFAEATEPVMSERAAVPLATVAGVVDGGNGPVACPIGGNGWVSTRPADDDGTEPATWVGGALLEAKGLAKAPSKRLVSELQPAALRATSARAATCGRKHERDNATGEIMVYTLMLTRKTYARVS
jgi:hypothetical protein